MNKKNIFYLGIIASLFIFFCSSCQFEEVKPNESGVLFKRFNGGLEKDQIYNQGIHPIAPWDRMIKYNTNIQEVSETISVLTKDGKTYSFLYKCNFQCKSKDIGYLHEEIGQNYSEIILKPNMRSVIREIFGVYLLDEIKAFEKSKWENQLMDKAKPLIEKKYFLLHSILIESIKSNNDKW
ncbi:MAG: SPFH domain-containing protein [Saprospiraceae bacterium]